MKKKNLFAVVAAIVLAFSMVACGDAEANNDSKATDTSVATDVAEESTVEDVAEESTVEDVVEESTEEVVASDDTATEGDLVIVFADLVDGGYGYEISYDGDAVNVSIANQYQELQYVLPEVVDLAAYTTLVVDVTANSQLDIKLVDPSASVNEYGQLAPFHDNYTDGTEITAPISIDLTGFADFDLSQINFMAMNNGTTFTLNSMTFVK